MAELYALFAQLTDPRKARGVRHRLAAVLTVAVFAVLAGAGNFRQVGDQVRDLPQVLLDAAGTRRHPVTGELVPPSGDTVRRLVEDIDAEAADLRVCQWVANRARPPRDTGDETDPDGK